MTEQFKNFVSFKVKQYLRLNSIEVTKENVTAVMKNKDIMGGFMKEAISAGC